MKGWVAESAVKVRASFQASSFISQDKRVIRKVGGFPGGTQVAKNPPALQEVWVRSLGWEDPLEKGIATHSSILAGRIPWTEELAGYSPWGRKESATTEHTHTEE